MSRADSSAKSQWRPDAAVGAWLLPGLGHALLGEPKRGLIIGLAIGLLWLGGLLIGGIGVVNRETHPAWFVGQAMTAPSLVSDFIVRRLPEPQPAAADGVRSAYEPSFGRVNEQGILYTALAGLLNLLAILDVAYREPGHRALRRKRRAAGESGAEQ